MDSSLLLAAATLVGQGGSVSDVKSLAIELAKVGDFITQLDEAFVFKGEVVAVNRIRTSTHDGRQLSGKAEVIYKPANPGSYTAADGTEKITTDWLDNGDAKHIAEIAKANIGHTCVFWKGHRDAPDLAQGDYVKELIWIEATVATASGNGSEPNATRPAPAQQQQVAPPEQTDPLPEEPSPPTARPPAQEQEAPRARRQPPSPPPAKSEPHSEEHNTDESVRHRISGLFNALESDDKRAVMKQLREHGLRMSTNVPAEQHQIVELLRPLVPTSDGTPAATVGHQGEQEPPRDQPRKKLADAEEEKRKELIEDILNREDVNEDPDAFEGWMNWLAEVGPQVDITEYTLQQAVTAHHVQAKFFGLESPYDPGDPL